MLFPSNFLHKKKPPKKKNNPKPNNTKWSGKFEPRTRSAKRCFSAIRTSLLPISVKIIPQVKSWCHWSHCPNARWLWGEVRICPIQFISDGMNPKQYYASFKEREAPMYCLYTNVISHTFIVLLSLIWCHAGSLWDATQTLCQCSQNWTPVLYFTNGF